MKHKNEPTNDFLRGEGEVVRLMRTFDWTRTDLGPAGGWAQSLKTAVRIMLDSASPCGSGGDQISFLYNDAYAKMTLGPKHPWAGSVRSQVWREIWNDISPRAEAVLRTGQSTWDEGLLLFLERMGFPEETYTRFPTVPSR